jgi:hypothetical protein
MKQPLLKNDANFNQYANELSPLYIKKEEGISLIGIPFII